MTEITRSPPTRGDNTPADTSLDHTGDLGNKQRVRESQQGMNVLPAAGLPGSTSDVGADLTSMVLSGVHHGPKSVDKVHVSQEPRVVSTSSHQAAPALVDPNNQDNVGILIGSRSAPGFVDPSTQVGNGAHQGSVLADLSPTSHGSSRQFSHATFKGIGIVDPAHVGQGPGAQVCEGAHQEVVLHSTAPASPQLGASQKSERSTRSSEFPSTGLLHGVHQEILSPASQIPENRSLLPSKNQGIAAGGDENTGQTLNPDASPFNVRDPSLLHKGQIVPDLDRDWEQVQRVQLGGVGDEGSFENGCTQ
jgi:hypothetical protein